MTPFYFTILFHIKREETILFHIYAEFLTIFDYLVLCLQQFTPPRLGLCFPGIEPMFDPCVCFGLLFTSDDNLSRTFIFKLP